MIKALDFSMLAVNWLMLIKGPFPSKEASLWTCSVVLCDSVDIPDSSVQRPEVPSSVEIQGNLKTHPFKHFVF